VSVKRLLFAIVAINALLWSPQLVIGMHDLNDGVLHWTIIREMATAANPLDFWSHTIAMGQPITRYYQIGAHALVVALWYAMAKLIPLQVVFQIVRWAAIFLLPLSVYGAARMLRMKSGEAVAAAALSCLVSADSWGLDPSAYVWGGYGLFAQSVANHMLLGAVGLGWITLNERPRLWPWLALLMAALAWTCFLWAWAAGICLILMVIVTKQWRRAWLVAAALVAAIWTIIPKAASWAIDGGLLAPVRWGFDGREWMVDGRGIAEATRFIRGVSLDVGHPPILTLLAVAGVAIAWRRRTTLHLFLIGGLCLFIYESFGRAFWGKWATLLLIGDSWQIHRVIGVVQIFAVLLGGVALAALSGVAARHSSRAAGVALCVLVLSPAINCTVAFARTNARWGATSLVKYQAQSGEFAQALAIARDRGGRVYAGFPAPGQWGRTMTVGDVPVYSALTAEGIPSVGIEFVGFLRVNDSSYAFKEVVETDYIDYDVRTVIAPPSWVPPPFLPLLAVTETMRVYGAPGHGMFTHSVAETITEGRARATVEMDHDGPIGIRIPYHPKWGVQVDGMRTTLQQLPSGFSAVMVASGRHEILMAY
jgi:hypothetical protein